MIRRFQGAEGKARLDEVFANQELVEHDDRLAQRLAAVAKLKEYPAGQELYIQGNPGKNHLYFVISGVVDLLVNARVTATIHAGRAVGEFPILDPALSYTVTVRARERCVIARVSESNLGAVAADYPEVWRNMARMLMRRLHSTHQGISPPKPPRVFIGHGRSGLWRRLQAYLEDDLRIDTVTYESKGRAGMTIVQILEEMVREATFAILVLTAEDATTAGSRRGRQNVVHEAGLFQGVLGFNRAILLVEHGVESFSNVSGLQHIEFESSTIESTLDELRRVLKRERQIR